MYMYTCSVLPRIFRVVVGFYITSNVHVYILYTLPYIYTHVVTYSAVAFSHNTASLSINSNNLTSSVYIFPPSVPM